jgi:hypothetical protein
MRPTIALRHFHGFNRTEGNAPLRVDGPVRPIARHCVTARRRGPPQCRRMCARPIPRRRRSRSSVAALRGVTAGPDVVNIRRWRRVAEKCHYHHRHRHRNDSG